MNLLMEGPADAARTFVFAHGAGGPMDSQFMNVVSRGLVERGVRVVRFEFPYMAARRSGRKRGAPDPPHVLQETWREVVTEVGDVRRLVIGGKSMGGRIATMAADKLGVAGVVCLGYPFHPPGQKEKLRTEHLRTLTTPTLILQGTRDAFGNLDEVKAYDLSPSIRIEWVPYGDHSFKPPAGSGHTERQNLEHAIETVAKFVRSLP